VLGRGLHATGVQRGRYGSCRLVGHARRRQHANLVASGRLLNPISGPRESLAGRSRERECARRPAEWWLGLVRSLASRVDQTIGRASTARPFAPAKETFAWLHRAFSNRDSDIAGLLYDPFILRHKDDSRFAAFGQRLACQCRARLPRASHSTFVLRQAPASRNLDVSSRGARPAVRGRKYSFDATPAGGQERSLDMVRQLSS
jgi:hypothetical protein